MQETGVLADLSILEVVGSSVRVLFVEGDGVVPPRAQVNYAIGVRRVELGELLHEDLDRRERELKRDFDDGRFVAGALRPFQGSHR